MAAPVDPIVKLVQVQGSAPGAMTDVNLAEVAGVATAAGAGVTTAGTQRVVVATDQAVLPVGGNVASGAADSGNPVKVGGRYNSTLPTLADGQRGDLQIGTRGSIGVTIFGQNTTVAAGVATVDLDGVSTSSQGITSRAFQYTFNGSSWDRQRGTASGEAYSVPGGLSAWNYAAASGGIVDNTELSVKAAAGAGIRNYITWLTLHNVSAVGTEFVVLDGSAGTVLWRGYAVALATGASLVSFPSPLKTTAATAVFVQCITTGTQTYVNLGGYTAP